MTEAARETGRSKKAATRAGRSDPRARHLSGNAIGRDGQPNWLKLVNADPNRVYVMPYKAGNETDYVSHLLSLGYVIEKYSTDGPKPKALHASHHIGEPIEVRGHVLMSIEKERAEEIARTGENGNGGLDLADAMELKIRRKLMHKEAFRDSGVSSKYAYADKAPSDDEIFPDSNEE